MPLFKGWGWNLEHINTENKAKYISVKEQKIEFFLSIKINNFALISIVFTNTEHFMSKRATLYLQVTYCKVTFPHRNNVVVRSLVLG